MWYSLPYGEGFDWFTQFLPIHCSQPVWNNYNHILFFFEAHVLHLIRGTLVVAALWTIVGMDWAVFLQVNAPEILEYK